MTEGTGRRADAVANDARILQAARLMFAEHGYGAHMADVARRAGVGVGTIYQRYANKDALIAEMNLVGMQSMIDDARAAATIQDPWDAFVSFMERCLAAGAGSLLHVAGTPGASRRQLRLSDELRRAIAQVLDRAKHSGDLRLDVTAADLYLLMARLGPDRRVDIERAAQLQRRYLAVVLDGLRVRDGESLPGPAPTWPELKRRWSDPG